jgi:hypothetical protein
LTADWRVKVIGNNRNEFALSCHHVLPICRFARPAKKRFVICSSDFNELRPSVLTKRARLALQILARFPLLLVEKPETKKPVYAPKKIGSRRVGQCGSNKREWTRYLA